MSHPVPGRTYEEDEEAWRMKEERMEADRKKHVHRPAASVFFLMMCKRGHAVSHQRPCLDCKNIFCTKCQDEKIGAGGKK